MYEDGRADPVIPNIATFLVQLEIALKFDSR